MCSEAAMHYRRHLRVRAGDTVGTMCRYHTTKQHSDVAECRLLQHWKSDATISQVNAYIA